jgi:hypothetical protein
MPSSPIQVLTFDPRPTVVIAETTTWEQFRSSWPKLLDGAPGDAT